MNVHHSTGLRAAALASWCLVATACGVDRAAQRDQDLSAAAQSLGLTYVADPDSAHQPLDRGPDALPSAGVARNLMQGTIGGVAVRAFDWHYMAQHILSDLERARSRKQPFRRDTRGPGGLTEQRPAATTLYVLPGIVRQRPFHFEARPEPDPGPATLETLYYNVVAADSAGLFIPAVVEYLLAHPGWSVETRGPDLIAYKKGQRCAPAELRACLEEVVGLARALTDDSLEPFADNQGRWGFRWRSGRVAIPAIYQAVGRFTGGRVFVVRPVDSPFERFAWIDSTGAIVERLSPDSSMVAPAPSDTCTTLGSYWSELDSARTSVDGEALGALDDFTRERESFGVYRLRHGAVAVAHANGVLTESIVVVPGLPRAVAEAFVARLNRLHPPPSGEDEGHCEGSLGELIAYAWGFGIRAWSVCD